MEISVVIFVCTLLTILGVVSMLRALANKKRPIELSGFHGLLTLAVFGVFTGYLVSELPNEVLTWPRISYMFYAIAGVVAIVALFVSKLLDVKLPKWVPVSYGSFEILGYGALWGTLVTSAG